MATVAINVTPNHAPTIPGGPLLFGVTKIPVTLTADDEDGDALTYSVLTTPKYGKVTGTAPNLFYEPAAGMNEIVTLTYQASDGEATSNIGTIEILTLAIGLRVFADDGAHTEANFAEEIFPGVGSQDVSITASADTPSLFSQQPAFDSTGTLRFTPTPNSQGKAVVTAVLHGAAEGEEGTDVDVTATFEIEIEQRAPWQNDNFWADGNDDGNLTSGDVLLVIDYINGVGTTRAGTDSSGPYYDTSGNNQVTPLDALAVINLINAVGPVEDTDTLDPDFGLPAEGETSAHPAILDDPPSGEGDLIALLATDLVDHLTRKRRNQ